MKWTLGDRADPPIVLVAGAPASMLWWDAELCERIAAGGRYVVRYDHRDTGRSTSYPPGEPGLPPPTDKFAEGLPADPDSADPTSVAEYVVASARAYAGGSPYFDEAATRALVERDVARARDHAATLVNHYAIEGIGRPRRLQPVRH